MKKYFIGMLALVLAVGFSAFTKAPVKNSTAFDQLYKFTYQSSSFAQTDVENEDVTHWGTGLAVGSTSLIECDNVDQIPCAFIVTQDNVEDVPNSNPVQKRLKTSGTGAISIIAAQYGSTGKFYVSTSTANLQALRNQPE